MSTLSDTECREDLQGDDGPPRGFSSTDRKAGILCLCVVAVAAAFAWICDDAFITLRYVRNVLDGYGPVYNVGERVQGFTHPLWFLLLLAASFIAGNEVFAAIGLGLVATYASLSYLGKAIVRRSPTEKVGVGVFVAVCAIFLSSDPWVSFQTSGLEGSLANLLVVVVLAEIFTHGGSRPVRLALWLTLLCLTRPDLILFALPLAVLVLPYLASPRVWLRIGLSISPGVLWALFAWRYYGSVLPNTAAAKLNIFPTWWAAVRQGLYYLADWVVTDSVAAITTCLGLGIAVALRRDRVAWAIVAASLLYLMWVIAIGGDFMRGRFFMPVFTAGLAAGALVLVERWSEVAEGRAARALAPVAAGLALIAGCSHGAANSIFWRRTSSVAGIVNERPIYASQSLWQILRNGRVCSPFFDPSVAGVLRAYADRCGPYAIHLQTTGLMGYLVGPKVTVIDVVGLTDRYIAHLPRELLVESKPRPGHPFKFIPIRYLAERGDVMLLPNWYQRLASGDCTLREEVRRLEASTGYLNALTGEVVPEPVRGARER